MSKRPKAWYCETCDRVYVYESQANRHDTETGHEILGLYTKPDVRRAYIKLEEAQREVVELKRLLELSGPIGDMR